MTRDDFTLWVETILPRANIAVPKLPHSNYMKPTKAIKHVGIDFNFRAFAISIVDDCILFKVDEIIIMIFKPI